MTVKNWAAFVKLIESMDDDWYADVEELEEMFGRYSTEPKVDARYIVNLPPVLLKWLVQFVPPGRYWDADEEIERCKHDSRSEEN